MFGGLPASTVLSTSSRLRFCEDHQPFATCRGHLRDDVVSRADCFQDDNAIADDLIRTRRPESLGIEPNLGLTRRHEHARAGYNDDSDKRLEQPG